MHYDPILCMNVPDTVRMNDASSDIPISKMNINQLRDLAVSLGADRNKLYGTSRQSIIYIIDKLKNTKSNDYKTCDAVYSVSYKSNGVYQSIGVKANSESEAVRKAKEHFESKKKEAEILGASIGESEETMRRKSKPILDSAFDKAIRSCDANEEKWITVKGSHVKIDGEGNPIVGNSNVIEAMKKKSDNKNNNKQSSSRKKLSSFAKSFIDDYDTDEIDEIIESNVHNWEEYNLLSPRQKVEKLFREWGEDDIQDFIDEYESDKHSSLRR